MGVAVSKALEATTESVAPPNQRRRFDRPDSLDRLRQLVATTNAIPNNNSTHGDSSFNMNSFSTSDEPVSSRLVSRIRPCHALVRYPPDGKRTAAVAREKHLSRGSREVPIVKRGYTPHLDLRRYQGEPVGERAELENGRVSLRNNDLAVDRVASLLRTRPPVDEEGEEVGCADVAIVIEIRRTAQVSPPGGE
ncbi:MAG: hypothetical protein V3T84_04865 [Phycisphaerales bacterium]